MLDLRKAAGFTDFFVICSGTNPRQIRAIADGVIEALAADGAKPAHVEGYERSEWILLDYFDFIVHVFAPETRVFYGLERLWGNAERIEITDIDCACRGGCRAVAALARRRAARGASSRPRCAACAEPARSPDARSGLRRLLATRSFRSRRRSATAAAIRCRSWRVVSLPLAPLPAMPAAAARRSIVRAPSAPTTGRCAPSSTRSSTTGGDRWPGRWAR